MTKLDDVTTGDLHEALEGAESAKAAKRLVVALAYKDGVDVDTIAGRYGFPQSTIYYWLDRFESRTLSEALRDEPRPGRPPKLSAEQLAEVDDWLAESPEAFGYDAETWTAERLRDHIAETFGIDYSAAHVHRRFLE